MRKTHYLVQQTVLQVISLNGWLRLNSKDCLVLLSTLSFYVPWSLYLRGWAMMLSFTHPFWALCKTTVVWSLSSTQFSFIFHPSIPTNKQATGPLCIKAWHSPHFLWLHYISTLSQRPENKEPDLSLLRGEFHPNNNEIFFFFCLWWSPSIHMASELLDQVSSQTNFAGHLFQMFANMHLVLYHT